MNLTSSVLPLLLIIVLATVLIPPFPSGVTESALAAAVSVESTPDSSRDGSSSAALPTQTPSIDPTAAPTLAPTATAVATPTSDATAAPTATFTSVATGTATAIPPTLTATATATATTVAGTATPTATTTVGATATATATTLRTATATPYATIATYTPTALPGAPGNDDFGSATRITSFPYSSSENTGGATLAGDDPAMGAGSGQNSATVWYSFVAPENGRIDVNTLDSDYDTVLSAFTGSRGSLSLVTSNDDVDNSIRQSEISFNVQSGTTYYLEVAGYDSRGGGELELSATFSSGATGTVTITPTATVVVSAGTPTPPVLGATAPTPRATAGTIPPYPAVTDRRYFVQTGYRITNDGFWDYFRKRGGARTFGYPVSRQFTLAGFQVQLFQRRLLQQMPDGSVVSMNLLDSGLMPYTRINGSTFPGQDPDLIDAAPPATDPAYAEKAIDFIRSNVPDQWNGQPVNFLQTFLSTVSLEDAFPQGGGDPALVPLVNLEIWGLPTSKPAYDPHNHGFVYQRFQRGILHYDAATGTTQGLLLGDYFKSIITGQNLPADLDQQAALSLFYRQYDRTKPGYLARPLDLRGTDLVGAFEMDVPQ